MTGPFRGLQQALYKRGWHVGSIPARTTIHSHLKRVLVELEINLVLDVGANRGDFGLMLREIGYNGRIVGFEPVAETWDLLTARRGSDSRWTAMNVALSSHDGEAEINLFEGDNFNSLHEASGFGPDLYEGKFIPKGKQRIILRRLDSVIGECTAGLPNPRILLKMDTQGHDLEVLEGASGCLDRVLAIQSEMAGRLLYSGAPDIGQSLSTLASLGFYPSGFYPVNESGGLTVIEWDCLLVRDPQSP